MMAGLYNSWQFRGATDSSVLASGMGLVSPNRTKGGRTGVPRGHMRPELVEGRHRIRRTICALSLWKGFKSFAYSAPRASESRCCRSEE
jgi:hypothetical protein